MLRQSGTSPLCILARHAAMIATVFLITRGFSFALALSSSSSSQLRFFIGGLGYCGSRLALRLREEFPSCAIAGCVRSEESRERTSNSLNMADVQVHVLDLDQEYRGLDDAGLQDLATATHVIQTIAPIADFDRDPFLVLHSETLQQSTSLQWVGYLSSTGVYGDHQGAWVDEDSELKCQDRKSLARVKAEAEWRQLAIGNDDNTSVCVDCFRCGGIYGPGRSPLFSVLAAANNAQEDTTSDNDNNLPPKYVNRILVDDICAAMVAVIKSRSSSNKKQPGSIYNLVDDDPAPRRDIFKEAQRLVHGENAGIKTDTDADTATSDTEAVPKASRKRPVSRNTGNKRCRNQQLKDDYPEWELLRVAPTYREGLAYLLQYQKQIQQEQL